MKTITLRSGDRMPVLGLGTWKSKPGEVGAAVKEAVRIGFRHIDCAPVYGNEREVGEALAACFAEGLVARDDLWITSKLWNDNHAPEDVEPALRKTLEDLRLDRLDLFLIHWPVAHEKGVLVPERPEQFRSLDDLPIATTWSAMEAAVDAGLTRNIGVSNFSAAKVGALLDTARVPPAADQVEMHPYLQQPELVEFCRENGVVVTAYSPLGSPDRPDSFRSADDPVLLEDPVVRTVAERRAVSPGQVLIAWAVQRGTVVIPKSVDPTRMRENLAAAELTLTDAEMQQIDGLDRHRRYVDGAFWATPGSPYTLAGLWDE